MRIRFRPSRAHRRTTKSRNHDGIAACVYGGCQWPGMIGAMLGKSTNSSGARSGPLSVAFMLVALFLSAGVCAVFIYSFLGSKPYKLMQPAWLPALLAIASVANAVGSVALAWRLLRRFPYGVPLLAAVLTVLANILIPSLLSRIIIGGSGEGDFGWRAATEDLKLRAGQLFKPVVLLGVVAGLIGAWCQRMWPGE